MEENQTERTFAMYRRHASPAEPMEIDVIREKPGELQEVKVSQKVELSQKVKLSQKVDKVSRQSGRCPAEACETVVVSLPAHLDRHFESRDMPGVSGITIVIVGFSRYMAYLSQQKYTTVVDLFPLQFQEAYDAAVMVEDAQRKMASKELPELLTGFARYPAHVRQICVSVATPG